MNVSKSTQIKSVQLLLVFLSIVRTYTAESWLNLSDEEIKATSFALTTTS